MKSFATIIAATLVPALIAAAPTSDGYKAESHSAVSSSKSTPTLFDFTSTYAAYASPDQV